MMRARLTSGAALLVAFALAIAIDWGHGQASALGRAPVPSGTHRADSRDRARHVVRAACEYLWARQAADGGWHSETYGLLKSGQALTPFVLHTLLSVPHERSSPPRGAIERGLDFIRRHTNGDGAVGMADQDVLEYPTYATSYALRCLVRAGDRRDRELVDRMRRWLVMRQFREHNGFSTAAPAYGGWGFGGPRPPGSPGHMDLAHTRRALEALRETGQRDRSMFDAAQVFLRLTQRCDDRDDGGFYFSPVVLDANKSKRDGARFRSYATATCDGVLSLLAAGVPADDPRVMAARRWLAAHAKLDYPEGVPADDPQGWGDAIHFYHLAVRAEAYAALDWPGEWREELAALLAAQQNADGSFVNRENHLMKENDPLLCTALALIAARHAIEPRPTDGSRRVLDRDRRLHQVCDDDGQLLAR